MIPEAHPELERAGSFEHLALGRLPRREDPRTLRLAAYLDVAALPEIPDTCDWTLGVPSWPMYGNDALGDCTCASAGHMVQGWTSAAGVPRVPTEDEVLGLYWATGSGDTGRFELDILNYWRQNGLGADKIAAFASVDVRDLAHVRAAIYLLGGVYAGVDLPRSAQGQAVWDVVDGKEGDAAPGSWGGHAVPYLGYDPAGFSCVTWGAVLKLTSGFHTVYADEAYAVVSPAWLNAQGQSPAGLALDDLLSDVAKL